MCPITNSSKVGSNSEIKVLSDYDTNVLKIYETNDLVLNAEKNGSTLKIMLEIKEESNLYWEKKRENETNENLNEYD